MPLLSNVRPYMPPPSPANADETEHLIYRALVELGWQADARRLANRVARLHLGLPREDEFAVVCTWLGRCALIHKLDQRENSTSHAAQFQIPDLLAVFVVDGKEVPVLIEVKSKKSETLSFRADYHAGLKRYASLLNLPLLIAWKYHGIWTLFDIDHMTLAKTNYNVKFSKAMREGLLGVLAGDFSYSLAQGSGIHLQLHKEQLISESKEGTTLEQQWIMRFEDVYYTDGTGTKRRDLAKEIESLFLAHELEDSEDHTDTHVTMHFTVGEDRNKFAHMSLVGLLDWHAPSVEGINWRTVATRPKAVPGIDDFAKSVSDALQEKVVTHIFHVLPQTRPSFLNPA